MSGMPRSPWLRRHPARRAPLSSGQPGRHRPTPFHSGTAVSGLPDLSRAARSTGQPLSRTGPQVGAPGIRTGLYAGPDRSAATEERLDTGGGSGHTGPDRIHRMLNRIEWDAGKVLDDVRQSVVDNLGDQNAVLVVEDTGFLKKGTRSAGVQRQYAGTAGRTENCQVGVFLAYATDRGRTLIDRRLYLPTSWTDDRERCQRAGIGDKVAFETKVAMAKAMVRRAIADKIPFRWVTADAAYGFSKGRRSELERADIFHVMATTRHDTLVTRWTIDHPVHDLFNGLG
ncbi:IS701 family transposase [Streptomyces flaveolus]